MRQLKISKSITRRENDSLDKYLSEIGKIPLISPEEEIILSIRIRQGDQMALNKLTCGNLRFVVSVAKQFQNQGLTLSDLINEGNLGLIKAAQRYDETKGFKFISYAVWWIRQTILLALSEQSRVVRLPHNKIIMINNYDKAVNAFEQQNEREPSIEELAEIIEMDEKDLSRLKQAALRPVSMDEPIGDENDSCRSDMTSSHDYQDPTDELIKTSLERDTARALNKLDARQAEIIRLLFGIGYESSMGVEEIGDKFNISRERVRQIKDKALGKLKKENSELLSKYLG